MVCQLILSEDIAGDDTGLLCLSNIGGIIWEDGVTVIGAAVSSQEADKTLGPVSVEYQRGAGKSSMTCIERTEKFAIVSLELSMV